MGFWGTLGDIGSTVATEAWGAAKDIGGWAGENWEDIAKLGVSAAPLFMEPSTKTMAPPKQRRQAQQRTSQPARAYRPPPSKESPQPQRVRTQPQRIQTKQAGTGNLVKYGLMAGAAYMLLKGGGS